MIRSGYQHANHLSALTRVSSFRVQRRHSLLHPSIRPQLDHRGGLPHPAAAHDVLDVARLADVVLEEVEPGWEDEEVGELAWAERAYGGEDPEGLRGVGGSGADDL